MEYHALLGWMAIKEYLISLLWKTLEVLLQYPFVLWSAVRSVLQHLAECEQRDLFISQFILLLLSALTSSINSSGLILLAATHTHAIMLSLLCLTDNVVYSGSEAFSFLCNFLFAGLWYKLTLILSMQRFFFTEFCRLLYMFSCRV